MSSIMSDKPKAPESSDPEMMAKYKRFISGLIPYDPRFPNQNQTNNCNAAYVDYLKCMKKKDDEEFCGWYKRAYNALCPQEWVERWEEQREEGTLKVRHII